MEQAYAFAELVLDVQRPSGRQRVDISTLDHDGTLIDGAKRLPPANLVTVHQDAYAVFGELAGVVFPGVLIRPHPEDRVLAECRGENSMIRVHRPWPASGDTERVGDDAAIGAADVP